MPVATSKSLRASTELLLVADIKPGLVRLPDPTTYATRLGQLFGALFALRKRSVELEGAGFIGPLERLRTLHFVRFSIFDQGRRLLLAVTFDKPWEPYIRAIVDDAGPILDVILSHCTGFETCTSKHGYPAFARWVREHQIETHYLHASFPEQSVDDMRYLRNLKHLLEQDVEGARSRAELALAARVGPERSGPPSPHDWETFDRVLVALYRLRGRFPEDARDPKFSDQAIYDRAAGLILNGFGPENLGKALEARADEYGLAHTLPAAILRAYNGIDAWLASLLAQPVAAEQAASIPPPRALDAFEQRVQGLVHPGYAAQSHGCLVLVRLPPERERTVELLGYLAEHVTGGDAAGTSGVKRNVGFTAAGLSKLGIDEETLGKLPVELRQGMEARAGLLGDVGTNHPERWQRPRVSWPDQERQRDDGDEIDLGTVDAVVLLQTQDEGIPGDHAFVARHPLRPEVLALEGAGAVILHVQALRRHPEQAAHDGQFREHFGYVDGIAQPDPSTEPARPRAYNNGVALGELLIGHLDDHDDVDDFDGDAGLRELLLDGSYLVIRDLAQDVGAFNGFVRERAQQVEVDAEVLLGKLMGRDLDGRPATVAPVSHLPAADGRPSRYADDFDYRKRAEGEGRDDEGAGCPLQAHIRLANPRQPVRASIHGKPIRMPRIARRGFAYGPLHAADSQAARGLLFMACNAKIAEQYEVIQRWLNGANATGLHSSQRDLLTAPHEAGSPTRFTFEHEGRTHTLEPAPAPFVTLRWGLYLLLPSMACLRALPKRSADALRRKTNSLPPGLSQATVPPAPPRGGEIAPDAQQRFRRGMALLHALSQVERSRAADEWKKVLEDGARREDALALWAAIRAQGGVLRTPYGVLVGNHDIALEVLRDGRRFSVREYWRRMRHASLLMYLGMDDRPEPRAVCPVHAGTDLPRDQSYVDAIGTRDVDYGRVHVANRYIHEISRVHAFVTAFDAAQRALHQVRQVALAAGSPRATLDLVLLADQAVSDVSERFFGLPNGKHMRKHGQPTADADPTAYCPADFTLASQYIFRPNPDGWTEQLSKQRGAVIHAAATRYVADTLDDPHPFVRRLREGLREELRRREAASGRALAYELEDEVVRSLVGSVDGFVAANWGSFLSTMKQWVDRDELARIPPELKRLGELCKGASAALSEVAFRDADPAQVAALLAARQRDGAATLVRDFDPKSQDPGARAPGVERARWALGKLAYELQDERPFAEGVVDTLKIFPVPSWLHRTAMAKTTLGSVAVEPGDAIVIHLGSAALEQPGPAMLFGGAYRGDDPDAPLHACPGRELALGVLLGMLIAVLQEQDLRPDEGALTLSFRVPDPGQSASAS